MHVFALWQGRDRRFNLAAEFPFRDDMQLAILGEIHAPIPGHSRFATHVRRAGVGVDKDRKHIKNKFLFNSVILKNVLESVFKSGESER